jgi:hypothetical protein
MFAFYKITMNMKLTSILSLLFLLTGTILNGQTYDLETSSRPYTPLVNGVDLIDFPWDDHEFPVPLGFEFLVFDEPTEFLVSPEIYTGGIFITSSLDFQSLFMIIPFGANLIDRGFEKDMHLSPILLEVVGNAGNRVATLEYRNAGFFSGELVDSISVDFINLQMRIFEESGDVEIHIGPYSITDANRDFDNNPGPSIGMVEDFDYLFEEANGEVLLLSGDPLNPTINTTFTDSYVNWPIPENTVYRFVRNTTSVNDPVFTPQQAFYYPNPTTGKAYLRTSGEASIISPVRIQNALGKTIQVVENSAEISLEGKPAGIYFLSFQTDKGRVTEKIQLMK